MGEEYPLLPLQERTERMEKRMDRMEERLERLEKWLDDAEMELVTQKDLLFGFCERYFNLGRGDFEVVSPEAGGY